MTPFYRKILSSALHLGHRKDGDKEGESSSTPTSTENGRKGDGWLTSMIIKELSDLLDAEEVGLNISYALVENPLGNP